MRNKEKTITIAMVSDKNYILPSKITLWSALSASDRGCYYMVHVLCSPQLAHDDRMKLKEIENHFDNIEIVFTEIDDKLFEDALVLKNIPVASYYRLMIPELIKADKCLFLDGDLIVNTDVSVLFNINMGDKLLAGVSDGGLTGGEKDEIRRRILDIPSMDSYINAGVLLWNLKEICKLDLSKMFIQCIGNRYPLMDNDILNKCCYGEILLLSAKYNLFSAFYNKKIKHNIYKEECLEVKDDDMILHYAYWTKPWKILRTNGADLWWDIAKKALEPCEYTKIRSEAEAYIKMMDLSYILETALEAKDIIIFGYTDIGKAICDSLLKNGLQTVRAFSDNAKDKHLQTYKAYNVYFPQEIIAKYPEAVWIVTSQNYYEEITMQLVKSGVETDKIVRYIKKDNIYFETLDDKYLEYEKREQELL